MDKMKKQQAKGTPHSSVMGPTGETSIKKKKRPNNTTPPTIAGIGASPNEQSFPKTPVANPKRSLWVHSPEDRMTIIDEAVNDAIQILRAELMDELEGIMEHKMADLTKPLITNITAMKTQMTQLQTECTALKSENADIKKKLTLQERLNRVNNLKVSGIREYRNETRFDCKKVVLSMLNDVGVTLHPNAITKAHREGPKISKIPRPIIITFSHSEDKDFILAKAHNIFQRIKVRIDEDFPTVTENNRKDLKPIMMAANRMLNPQGLHKYKATLHEDTLRVNNKAYTIDSIGHLPKELSPESTATPSKNGITAFFTKRSPLSNHHPSPMRIKNKLYSCNEQYYMEQKALVMGDIQTAKAIMATSDPSIQKKLGRDDNIKNFKVFVWDELKIEIMEEGLTQKFKQNENLRNFLLRTNDNTLIEGNPGDKFWGAGLSIYNPRIWIKNSLLGNAHNHLGRLLMNLRRTLRQNS